MSVHDANYKEVKKLLGIPEDEPIFILRAQDKIAPSTIEGYAHDGYKAKSRAAQEADDTQAHKEARMWRNRVLDCSDAMFNWQEDNETKVKIPD